LIVNEAAVGSLLRNRKIKTNFDTALLLKQRVGSFRYGRIKPKAYNTYAAKSAEKKLRFFFGTFVGTDLQRRLSALTARQPLAPFASLITQSAD